MQKTKRQLFALALVPAALLLIYAVLTLRLSPQKPEEGTALNFFDADKINGISYLLDGGSVTLEKDADGEWYAPTEPQRCLRQGPAAAMAAQSGRLQAVDTVPENAVDLSAYGLAEPANVITLRQEAMQVTYLIGAKNSVTGDYYLQIQGKPQIYTVKEAFVQAFYGDVRYLTEPEESR